jgi:hypothetical protein
MKFKKILFIIIVLSICIFLLYLLSNNTEGFITLNSLVYSDTTVNDYNNYITNLQQDNTSVSPITIDDLQKVGVPESDVENFIKTGTWVWSNDFMNAMKQTQLNVPNMDETSVTNALTSAQKSVPEQYYIFLYAAGYSNTLKSIGKKYNIGCNIDTTTNKSTGDSMYTLDASGNVTTTTVDNSQLPTLIPGFTFIDTPCNPCNVVNGNFSCAYAIPDDQNQPIFPGFVMNYAFSSNTSMSSQVNDVTSSISHLF